MAPPETLLQERGEVYIQKKYPSPGACTVFITPLYQSVLLFYQLEN